MSEKPEDGIGLIGDLTVTPSLVGNFVVMEMPIQNAMFITLNFKTLVATNVLVVSRWWCLMTNAYLIKM